MLKRTISGAIYAALILAGILGGAYSFAALFLLIALLCTWELVRLFRTSRHIRLCWIFNGIATSALFLSAFIWFSGLTSDPRIFVIWPTLLLGWFIASIYRRDSQSIESLLYSVFTQIYIGLPLLLLATMPFRQGHSIASYDYVPVLGLFIFLWASDTMAFLCGRAFGKHKLLERISPKKTWEGFFGGLIFSLLAALVLSFAYPDEMSRVQWIVYGGIVSLFGVWGDLFESQIKRWLQVKDSGNMIPGHGGILDRMDSCLLAIPAATLFLLWIA